MQSQRHSVLGSAVFQNVTQIMGGLLIGLLALIWALCGLVIWQLTTTQSELISEAVAEAEDIYYGQGADQLAAFLSDGDDLLWSDEMVLDLRRDEQLIYVLREPNYDPVAGFDGLHSEEGWQIVDLDHQGVDRQVRAFKSFLRGGATLTVGAFLQDRRFDTLSLAWFTTYALIAFTMIFAPSVGWVLSRRVSNRVATIADTTSSVASGAMTARVAVSGRGDEFDRLGRDINVMLDQVERLNRNIESVSVGVAHDLRTPLSNIGGRLELIARDKDDPDAVADHASAADSYLSQLMRIFDAMLRLGEVEAGKRQAAFAKLNLSDLVTHMGAAYEAVFADADKSLAVNATSGIMVKGDQELLEQLLSNLLENALEHSRDAAKAYVKLEQINGVITLTIGDDGPGISPADRDRIFDRFFRADASRTTPGNGLGLSLVKAIADLHQADIRVAEGTPGAVFVLTFAQAG